MKHFPIFLNLVDQHIIVIGGGEVAMAKLRLLMKTEAKITVHAGKIDATIEEWVVAGRLYWRADAPTLQEYARAALVYVALDNDAEAQTYADAARAAGVLVNMVDNLEGSDFITPAIVDRDPVTVAIGTEGAAPVLARQIKSHLEAHLPVDLGDYVGLGARLRARVATRSSEWRRAFWSWYYDTKTVDAWRRDGQAVHLARVEAVRHDLRPSDEGFVVFVGAGPGDPELLTLRARRALDQADVVIYDRLVDGRILELARREARLIDVGKTPYQTTRTQTEINDIIIAEALNGANVVRLKSGDAVIYGRLDEEIAALVDANIGFEVVPGISAANAAAASIGASLTRRGRNSSLRFVTGHDAKGFADYQWRELAAEGQALAIYMGRRSVTYFCGRLLMHGARATTPVTAIANVSRPDESRLDTNLRDLPATLENFAEGAPVVILYGVSSVAAERQAASCEIRQSIESLAL